MKIANFQVASRLASLVGTIILTTLRIGGFFGEQTRTETILLFEDSDLSQWTRQGKGKHTGVVLEDPLKEERALSFCELKVGFDLFTHQSFTSPTSMYLCLVYPSITLV